MQQQAAGEQGGERAAAAVPPALCCCVPGCHADLTRQPKIYCLRKHLCILHLQADSIQLEDDRLYRFCFQCGRLEPLAAFDGNKRTCRQRLLKRRNSPSGKRRHHHQQQKRLHRQPAVRGRQQAVQAGAAMPLAAELLPAASGMSFLDAPLGCSSGASNGSATLAPSQGACGPSPSAARWGSSPACPRAAAGCGDSSCGYSSPRAPPAALGWGGRGLALAQRAAPAGASSTEQQLVALVAEACPPQPQQAVSGLSLGLAAPCSTSSSLDQHMEEEGACSLELVLESELTAAAAAASTRATSPDDAHSRQLAWQLAAALVENSLALPGGADPGRVALMACSSDGSSGCCCFAPAPPPLCAASSMAAAGRQQQLALCAGGAAAPPLLLAAGLGMAGGMPAEQAGPSASLVAQACRLQVLRSQMARLHARVHMLREQMAA